MMQPQLLNTSSLSSSEFQKIYEIIRIAYAETEFEMFGPDYIRISSEELKEILNSGQLLIARSEEGIVGVVRHYFVEKGVYSFGLLAVDFEHLGKGIAKALVKEVESIAVSKGANTIRIEILRPESLVLKGKEDLKKWYLRLGYELTGSKAVAEILPEKEVESIRPLIFDFYFKQLKD